jgi:predicted dehydrogenase
MKRIRLGIVGCGAVTQTYHLPASKFAPNIEIKVLVDKNLEPARTFSKKYNIPHFESDYQDTYDLLDGVIIALPHNLHSSVSIDFLKHKIPVLCEKPIATTSSEAREMLDASRKYKTPLAIGFMRRFYRSSRQVKKTISTGILGELDHFDFEEGSIFQWKAASGFFFQKDAAGGGVLIDIGSHTLDLLLWWLNGNMVDLEYKDDSYGGIEANCLLELAMMSEGKRISGRIELSRERKLRNSCKIFGSKGRLEFFPHNTESIHLHLVESSKNNTVTTEPPVQTRNVLSYFAQQLCDFGHVCAGEKTPHVDGTLAYHGIKIIEDCYKNRKNYEMPWITHGLNSNERQQVHCNEN